MKDQIAKQLLEFPYTSFEDLLHTTLKKHPDESDNLSSEEREQFEKFYARIEYDFGNVSGAPLDAGVRKKLYSQDYERKANNLSDVLSRERKQATDSFNQLLFDELLFLNENKVKKNIHLAKLIEEKPEDDVAKQYAKFTLSFANKKNPVTVISRKPNCNDVNELVKEHLGKDTSSLDKLNNLFAAGIKPDEFKGEHSIIDAIGLEKVALHPFHRDAEGKATSGFANFYHTTNHLFISQIFEEKKELRMSYFLAKALENESNCQLQLPGQYDENSKEIKKEDLLNLRMQFFQNLLNELQMQPFPYNQMTLANLENILKIEIEKNKIRSPYEKFYINLGFLENRNINKFATYLHQYLEQKTTQAVGRVRLPRNEYFDIAIRMINSLIADSNGKGILYFYNQMGNVQLLQAMRIVADAFGIPYKDQTGYGYPATTPEQINAFNSLLGKEVKEIREFIPSSWFNKTLPVPFKKDEAETLAQLTEDLPKRSPI